MKKPHSFYDEFAKQVQDALTQQYPLEKWSVGDSMAMWEYAETHGIPWERARTQLRVCVERNGYAVWFPAPYGSSEQEREDLVTMIGRAGLSLVEHMRDHS